MSQTENNMKSKINKTEKKIELKIQIIMEGIYYRDGVYVVINTNAKNDICIYRYQYKNPVSLYGGRIKIVSNYDIDAHLYVDGISILKIEVNSISKDLPNSTIVSHLNAIEANGIDAFLQNYKKSIEFLYGELKEFNYKTESQLSVEHDDSKVKSLLLEIEKIRTLLFSVLAILFSLHTYMAAGLENDKVRSVCQSIMDSLV